ncbi:hypothetical protein ASPBRDRAFT_574374 [Aspergillus brasiliensis CBS 101740]|uniref:Uncharacterized protein n=1 Tax=Aspergillus brasiliensis (strain CBS 101740 / IMI 381727 / IBT 21946) TaxID=767769 RepID=A0A1L9UJA1_ASPBC|nr:hypothetical protein ASPBRDRAFT_574374 [Aspergillus brasiliensis CBS 101740]
MPAIEGWWAIRFSQVRECPGVVWDGIDDDRMYCMTSSPSDPDPSCPPATGREKKKSMKGRGMASSSGNPWYRPVTRDSPYPRGRSWDGCTLTERTDDLLFWASSFPNPKHREAKRRAPSSSGPGRIDGPVVQVPTHLHMYVHCGIIVEPEDEGGGEGWLCCGVVCA